MVVRVIGAALEKTVEAPGVPVSLPSPILLLTIALSSHRGTQRCSLTSWFPFICPVCYISFSTSCPCHKDQYLGLAKIHSKLSNGSQHDKRLLFKNTVFSEYEAIKIANLILRHQDLKKCYLYATDNSLFLRPVSEPAESKLGRRWEWDRECFQLDNLTQQFFAVTQRRIGHIKLKDQKGGTWQGSIKQ